MNKTITECISQLDNEILEKEKQILLLKCLDTSTIVSEDMWHELCQTPLRNSDLLCRLISNIFPNAMEIQVCCNYVYFTLYGYKIQLPTSSCRGINVDTAWFYEITEPTLKLNLAEEKMKKYFECVDAKLGWYDCAKCRLGRKYKKWYLFIIWWTKYKWKDAHRKDWEDRFSNAERRYRENIRDFLNNKALMDKKIILFVEKVLPEINKFSTEHYSYNENGYIGIDKILDAYKVVMNCCF